MRHLLDVNVLVALAIQDHPHQAIVKHWFYAEPDLRWAVCAFVEAGFLRIATAATPHQIPMTEATDILREFHQHPGYRYYPISQGWHTLTAPFEKRLYGTKQVTDAYLLGLAVHDGLMLVTMDKAMLHLAGEEHRGNVLLLREPPHS